MRISAATAPFAKIVSAATQDYAILGLPLAIKKQESGTGVSGMEIRNIGGRIPSLSMRGKGVFCVA
jgi:hypothetical protein